MTIDAIILTFTKDLFYYGLTQRTIQTLRNRNKNLDFNLIVVEGNTEAHKQGYVYNNTHTLVLAEKFNYNRFLNHGLSHCKNKYILICNNDLIFHESSVENLINHMEKYDVWSACPQEPNWHAVHFDTSELSKEFIAGHRIMHEVTGWCICMRNEIIRKMGSFDEQFDYYYQDNDYAMFLKTNGIDHHLVNNSTVSHELSQSEILLDRDIHELSAELKKKFENKWEKYLN
jgi:GT2 family glycosyltransferase